MGGRYNTKRTETGISLFCQTQEYSTLFFRYKHTKSRHTEAHRLTHRQTQRGAGHRHWACASTLGGSSVPTPCSMPTTPHAHKVHFSPTHLFAPNTLHTQTPYL